METIVRIQLEHFANGKGIKRIARELGISRNTMRKIPRSETFEFSCGRTVQPQPKLGAWAETLTANLEAETRLPRRQRPSTQRLIEELRGRGYDVSRASVCRFVRPWRAERARAPVQVFVPLSFDSDEADQFDWIHEAIALAGMPHMAKVVRMWLAFSRMPFVRARFREGREMAFDAHDKAFAFQGGTCRRKAPDNMKTAMESIFFGRQQLRLS